MTINKKIIASVFSVRPHIPIVDEIIRIMCLQMDVSIELTNCETEGSGEAIHEIRKYFKKLRGISRLVKQALGPQTYEQENMHYRNLGRLISPLRDASVYLVVWEKLLNESEFKSIIQPVYDKMKKSLNDSLAQKNDQYLVKEDRFNLVRKGIISAKERLTSTPGFVPTQPILKQGLTDTFNSGKTAMQNAINDPSVENLHEWRKQVKYLMYQLHTINQIAKGLPDKLYTDLDVLSDLLGDDHDYAELVNELQNHMEVLQYDEYLEKLKEIIESVRLTKQKDAWPLGKIIYNKYKENILASLD